jgi:O-methyltransferase involved in polyketide biosynthesis
MKISMESLADGVPITMLIPLYARASESQRPAAMFQDAQAVRMLGQIDYDFSAFAADPATQLGIAIRTEILDEWARDYLNEHPQAQVINLGAGLDTRFERLDTGHLTWLELDLPNAIQVRQYFLPSAERHPSLAHSALDFAWMEHPSLQAGRPTLIIAEGLLMYFQLEQVQGMLQALRGHFPGGQMLLEYVGQHMITYPNQSVSSTANAFQWGLDDPQGLTTWAGGGALLAHASIYDRCPERWKQLYPDLKKPLAALRHKVTQLARLEFQ